MEWDLIGINNRYSKESVETIFIRIIISIFIESVILIMCNMVDQGWQFLILLQLIFASNNNVYNF